MGGGRELIYTWHLSAYLHWACIHTHIFCCSQQSSYTPTHKSFLLLLLRQRLTIQTRLALKSEILLPVCQVPELNVYNHSELEKRVLRRRKHSKYLYSALIRRDKDDFPIKFSAIFKFFTPRNSYLQPFLVVFAFQPFPFLVVLVISLPFPIYQKQCKTIWCKTSMYLHVHKHFTYKTLN